MTTFFMVPLQPVGDRQRQNQKDEASLRRRPTDAKIRALLLARISLPIVKEGSLLAAASAPQVVVPASNAQKKENLFYLPRHKRQVRRSAANSHKYFPIGLAPSEHHNWINALMQFLLYIPLLREVFAYTPQSLYPFNEFIDQYLLDMEEKKVISKAESVELLRCLQGKFPRLFVGLGIANLHEIILAILQSASFMANACDACFKPDWQLLWDPMQDLDWSEVFARPVMPPELLVGLKPLYDDVLRDKPQSLFCHSLLKQYYSSQSSVCYELDAFVEHRMDEEGGANFFTYLKIDGTWVQCADKRIQTLRRSTSLNVPLRRAILFHYRRVWAGQAFGAL